MKDKDVYDEISSIKKIMERSTRFISLSGLSGVMAGVYALAGAGIAFKLLYLNGSVTTFPQRDEDFYRVSQYFTDITEMNLIFTGLVVLMLSIFTGVWLTIRKAKRKGLIVWNESSRLF